MVFAIVLILLIFGSLLFHVVSPWYLTELASNWSTIDFTLDLTFWVTGVVFVAVNLFMAYAVIKFRYNRNRRSEYKPEDKKLEGWLTGITAVGVAALLTPGLFVWADFVTVPEDAHVVEAVGQQWNWSYRLPGEDGKLGAVESRFISDDNPFGMDADDPDGQDDVLITSQTVHVPLDKPVKFNLRSLDVLHDFAVAQFRVKMDLVPGLVSYLWFTPTRTGSFEVLCEEHCGLAHFAMRGMVVVDEQADYDAWLAAQPTYSEILAMKAGDPSVGEGTYAVCVACHGAAGEGNQALNGPKLAGQEGWYMRRQLQNFKSGARGAHEDDETGKQMAAMAGMLVDDAAIENVIAYIETLPDNPPPTTIVGDVASGEKIYRNCSVCHGVNGEGKAATRAPRQAGMSDWYIASQLKKFRDGIRGAHPDDDFGMQMNLMAAILQTEDRVNDVVAYINTLSGKKPQQVATRENH